MNDEIRFDRIPLSIQGEGRPLEIGTEAGWAERSSSYGPQECHITEQTVGKIGGCCCSSGFEFTFDINQCIYK